MNIRTAALAYAFLSAPVIFTAPDEPPVSTTPLLQGVNRSTGQTGQRSLDQRGVYGESMVSIFCCCCYTPYRLWLLYYKGDKE